MLGESGLCLMRNSVIRFCLGVKIEFYLPIQLFQIAVRARENERDFSVKGGGFHVSRSGDYSGSVRAPSHQAFLQTATNFNAAPDK